jgi:hypothetical protein
MFSDTVAATNPPSPEEVKATSPEAPKTEAATSGVVTQEDDRESGEKQHDDPKVLIGAVTRLRAERRQLDAEARAKDAQLQQFMQIQAQRDQEWQIAQQRMQQVLAAQFAEPEPDKNVDPLAYVARKSEQAAAEVQAMRQQQYQRDQAQWAAQQQYAQQAHQQQAVQQFVHRVTASEAQFREEHPDYQEALTYAVTRRTKELTAAGWDPDEARGIAGTDARNLALQWVQRGQDPAAMAYEMSKAMGYQPVDKEAMHEQGYKASKPSGGGSARGKLTVRQIANMTPMQLARISDEDFKAAMGG